MKKESVAILVIIIGKYITFWPELYSSAKKYFLPQHNKTFFYNLPSQSDLFKLISSPAE